jgi:hypothetical protein
MSHQSPSEHDIELLSAYLDGELSHRERTALEQQLAQDPVLRSALQGLRETVSLVHALPRLKAPRNFTLDASHHAVPWWLSLGTILQLSGAVGAAASVALIILALVLTGGTEQKENTQSIAPAETSVGYASDALIITPSKTPESMKTPTPAPSATGTPAPTNMPLPTMPPLPTTTLAMENSAAMAMPPAAGSLEGETSATAPLTLQTQSEATVEESPSEMAMDQAYNNQPGPLGAEPTNGDGMRDTNDETATGEAVSGPLPTVGTVQAFAATAPEQPPIIVTTVEQEQYVATEEPQEKQVSAPSQNEENDSLWLIGSGIGLLVISLGVFIWGRFKA